jgi:GH15 family glucan-1,4-alpha-glucosidase
VRQSSKPDSKPHQNATGSAQSRIEDYAVIGDCGTAALVARNGSIDWLCWPRFDSDACFAALLGQPEHGRWLIAPCGEVVSTRRQYRDRTLILETEMTTRTGSVVLVDFMPMRDTASDLVRLVIGKSGQVDMRMEMIIRFGYGVHVPWVHRLDEDVLVAIAGPEMLTLTTPIPTRGEDFKTLADFTVAAGDVVPFVLMHSPSHLPVPERIDPEQVLAETEAFWEDWSSRCAPAGDWSDAVLRSLISLKALTYAATGGIVAAPTTSLPEKLGGTRNWDYRYCWLRDSTQTLRALMDAGYYEEAGAWRDWLVRAAAGSPGQMQIMYGLAGERRLTEWEAPWLPGYQQSQPVRIGNDAHVQLQLDVFGEVIDTLHQASQGGLAPSETGWQVQRALLGELADTWRKPDHGIWEIRGAPRHFTYSKAMAWVAFDRAIKSAEAFELEGAIESWKAIRQEIHEDVCANGYDSGRGCFVQSYGTTELDASLLLLPVVGFLPPDDPRIRRTVEAIERELTVDGLVVRYDTHATVDGLPPGEGAFLACSFWLADALLLLGRETEARALFERLLELRNDVGLLSEEYDPRIKCMLGNFPQAFSCVALVNTAYNLVEASKSRGIPSRAARTDEPGNS